MEFLSRENLARRWGLSERTIDRLRSMGQLPWLDLARGKRARPIVRFALEDVEAFEVSARLSQKGERP